MHPIGVTTIPFTDGTLVLVSSGFWGGARGGQFPLLIFIPNRKKVLETGTTPLYKGLAMTANPLPPSRVRHW